MKRGGMAVVVAISLLAGGSGEAQYCFPYPFGMDPVSVGGGGSFADGSSGVWRTRPRRNRDASSIKSSVSVTAIAERLAQNVRARSKSHSMLPSLGVLQNAKKDSPSRPGVVLWIRVMTASRHPLFGFSLGQLA